MVDYLLVMMHLAVLHYLLEAHNKYQWHVLLPVKFLFLRGLAEAQLQAVILFYFLTSIFSFFWQVM